MPRFRVTVLDHPAALAGHTAAWNDLAAAALEPNVFYEPWMMLPAIDSFARGENLRYVLIYADQAEGPPLLCGLFPLERVASYKGMPFRHVRLWQHKHCFLGTPLVRSTHARECLAAFLDWLEADPQGASAIKWGVIGADGPFFRALSEVLGESGRRSFVPYRFARAVMRPRAGGDAFLGEALSHKGFKELQRLERRLAETGPVEYAELESTEQAEKWIADFLELEARGWKGLNGSALGSTEAGRLFFTRTALAAARRRRLMMLGLRVAGRWVALKCNFLAGEGSSRPELHWMDSCAESDHFMVNRLWLDRRALLDLVTTTGRAAGDLMVSSLPLLHWASRTLRGAPAAAAQARS